MFLLKDKPLRIIIQTFIQPGIVVHSRLVICIFIKNFFFFFALMLISLKFPNINIWNWKVNLKVGFHPLFFTGNLQDMSPADYSAAQSY